MMRPAFGQREAKKLAHPQTIALKAHADYLRGRSPQYKADSRREGPLIDRVLAWLSYFTLVFVTMITLTPDSAAAAVFTVHQIVTTALPG